jgi:hypothetical protein
MADSRITFRAAAGGNNDASPGDPVSIARSSLSGLGAKDVLYALVKAHSATATITATGWTLVDSLVDEIIGVQVRLYRRTAGSGTSYAFSATDSAVLYVSIYAASGVYAAAPDNTHGHNQTASGVSHATDTITPTTDYCLLLAAYAMNDVDTLGGPEGMAARLEDYGGVLSFFDVLQTEAAAVQKTATTDTNNVSFNFLAALEPIPAPTGSVVLTEVSSNPQQVVVNAGNLVAPTGYSITGWSWNWGDGSDPSTGSPVASHTYATPGAYTVTLTVTLDEGTTRDVAGGATTMSMVVNRFLPPHAEAGGTVVIQGSGFGSTKVTASITVGGQAATLGNWADGEITITLNASTPETGPQDVVITNDAGEVYTYEDGIFVYDSTSRFASANLQTGKLSKVYVDGVHIGFCEADFAFGRSFNILDFRPNDRGSIVKTFTISTEESLRLTLSEFTGKNVALALGGTWDSTDRRLIVAGSDTPAEHGILVVDAIGIAYVFPRCQVIQPSEVVLNREAKNMLPITFRCLAQDTDEYAVFIAYWPS